ncbi:MAG: acireductone synthase [Gammaproteobacteria bacterium]
MIEFPGRGILLDIEGTTSSIEFVYQTLFPYARRALPSFLETHWDEPAVTAARERIAHEAGAGSFAEFHRRTPALSPTEALHQEVLRLMDADAKLTGFKQLQGLIWKQGYTRGELLSQVFPDGPRALAEWAARGIDVRIYSSGSLEAQRQFFAHTAAGSLTHLLRGYYDTTVGPKREPASYAAIAADMKLSPGEILFLSDVPAELDAARAAGLATALVSRPGNAPVADDCDHPTITDFQQIVIAARRSGPAPGTASVSS